MISIARTLPCLLATLALIATPLAQAKVSPADQMLEAAQNFIKSLDEKAKAEALFPFDSKRREAWNFLPDKFIKPDGKRYGLTIKKMTVQQRILAQALLASSLSHKGYLQASTIMTLEQILFDMEGRDIRQPDLYYVCIFGTPAKTGTWGWRFEGHHLSLSFTLVNSRVFSVTPAFLATNPAEVKQGAFEGLRVLAEEEDLARRLAKSLNNKQKQSAILSDKAPDDILTKWDPTVDRKTFFPPKGVQYKDLNPRQKGWLLDIIDVYTSKHRKEIVEQIDNRSLIKDTESMYFTWAGSLEKERAITIVYRPMTGSLSTTVPRTMPIMCTPCGETSMVTLDAICLLSTTTRITRKLDSNTYLTVRPSMAGHPPKPRTHST